MNLVRIVNTLFLLSLLSTWAVGVFAQSDAINEFVTAKCVDCHRGTAPEGELDLERLQIEGPIKANLERWISVFDRVSNGEMPPASEGRVRPAERQSFLDSLSKRIVRGEDTMLAGTGRSVKRRLNRYEYENSLRDLLSLPNLSIKDSLPEDGVASGFNKVGEALDISHVQIARYIEAAESALREAMAPQVRKPELIKERFYTWKQLGFRQVPSPIMRKTFPLVGLELQTHLVGGDTEKPGFVMPDLAGSSRPDRVDDESVSLVVSTYEPTQIQFNNFRAPVSGWYRLKFAGYTIWMSPGYDKVTRGRYPEPISIYADRPPAILRNIGSFEFQPEPAAREITAWLDVGETIRPDAVRLVRSRPPDHLNPLQEEDGMPGVAFQWMEVEGPLIDQWPEAGHRLLFGELPITDFIEPPDDTLEKYIAGMRRRPRHEAQLVLARYLHRRRTYVDIHSANPKQDSERLLRRFVAQAYRHPGTETDLRRFLKLIHTSLEQGHSFSDSMIAGYTAVLTSPRFLFLDPPRGLLTAHALAERLSYFLWNSPPDEQLTDAAESGELLDQHILRGQVDRMLNDPRSARFVSAFLDYWLDLRFMNASGPDAELYPDYQLDDHLTESMVKESQLYFSEMLQHNLSVDHIVDSDFLIINERLAKHYGIESVQGPHFRKFTLDQSSARGGFMTQASVLKVTANGTTTSPVTRGVWMMERILGMATPPPPPSVPAIESDIRGATTIREQLALHRSDAACNQCHKNIDPAGFALENFDVMGGWRDNYRTSGSGQGIRAVGVGHNGLAMKYRYGKPVDAGGALPDGKAFDDVTSLKKILVVRKEQLARNLTRQFAVYATGAPIRFSDREQIAGIINRARESDFGVRDLILELVTSDLFLKK